MLAANALVIGGGAGTAPSTVTTDSGVLAALGHALNGTSGLVGYSGNIGSAYGTSLNLSGSASIQGMTVSLGAGSNNSLSTAFGVGVLSSNTTGSVNTGFGAYSLVSNTTGSNNVAAGYGALILNTTGSGNMGLGSVALVNNVSGNNNVASGYEALSSNTTGSGNVGDGSVTLYDLGSTQTAGAFGIGTSYIIVTVGTTDFVAIGASGNTIGGVFTATGAGSGTGTANPVTNNNTAIGFNTGRGIIYGINNTIVGAAVTGLPAGLSDAVIFATGEGTIRANFGDTVSTGWTFTGTLNSVGGYYAGGTKGVTCPSGTLVVTGIVDGIITAATSTGGTCS